MKESILDYEKMVYSIISKYSYNKNDLEDLYQVGMIALSHACDNFKEGYNTKFSSYAHLYIKGEILKYIRENRLVKVNKDYIKLNSLISKTREALTQKYMREPTISEISLFLEVPVEVLNDAILANDYVKSLDYTLNDEGKEMDLYDSVGYNEKEFDPMILDLRNEIEKLDPEDRKLINLRYYQDKSQQETSRELGINQVQVSRRENKILVKLNQKLAS